ncbi:MAG: TMEM165/GDT1 family protein [Cyanobacteria bacterium P01_F01_bin.150]
MDWKLLLISFTAVFISELGDKSQLAAIVLSSNSKSFKPIFWGASSALLLATLLGVWLGGGLGEILPVRWVKAIAALGFATMAIRLLWKNDSQTVTY